MPLALGELGNTEKMSTIALGTIERLQTPRRSTKIRGFSFCVKPFPSDYFLFRAMSSSAFLAVLGASLFCERVIVEEGKSERQTDRPI